MIPVIPVNPVIPVIPVSQVVLVIPVIPVIPVSPVSPVSPVGPVSPVSLAHLWVDFRVILSVQISKERETCRWDASSATSTDTKSDRQLRACRVVAEENRALTLKGKRAALVQGEAWEGI